MAPLRGPVRRPGAKRLMQFALGVRVLIETRLDGTVLGVVSLDRRDLPGHLACDQLNLLNRLISRAGTGEGVKQAARLRAFNRNRAHFGARDLHIFELHLIDRHLSAADGAANLKLYLGRTCRTAAASASPCRADA